MKFLADNRERKVIQVLHKRKLKFEEKQLVSADFIIGNIGIERKTQNDFLNSIMNKRLIDQLISLKDNFEIPILIIEGEENLYEMRNFHPNAIRGMLVSIAIVYQIPIIYTRNINDTVSVIEVLLNQLERGIKPIGLLRKRKPLTLKEQQELIVECFPGIGPTIAKNILKEFGSIKSFFNCKEEELLKVEKVGDKKAQEILKVINSSY
ncbi:MAG: ERCC4 domain-containing protein [Candidatus Nanoarchaeia archaeon]|nr:ERCC4 domain-containing protein [Candidatus Nanoarchaeia archaeon]MDD5587836.1 ERCC4 domain-containing protein [Candidatus Nanoarchaeia archaeon]